MLISNTHNVAKKIGKKSYTVTASNYFIAKKALIRMIAIIFTKKKYGFFLNTP